MRKRKEPLEIVEKIITERQPVRMHEAWDFAKGYAAFKSGSRCDFYSFVQSNFNVDKNNIFKTINTNAVKFTGKSVLERMKGDYFLVNLSGMMDSRFGLILKNSINEETIQE